jgi:23S rRNA pseudouridine2605 synthase
LHSTAKTTKQTQQKRTPSKASKAKLAKFAKPPSARTTSSSVTASTLRLNKFIADAGIGSRRKADELIEQGVVRVNGDVVTELGRRVHLSDLVTVNGEPINAEKHLTYILLNKPKDYITTVSDEKGRKTVMDLLPERLDIRVYPVGRLDRHTTGALLLTNDGDMAHRLMHPQFGIARVYSVYLDKRLRIDHARQIAQGVEVAPPDGEPYTSAPCELVIDPQDGKHVTLEIKEGKNREVRRIFEALGYDVERLDRKWYAGLSTRGMARGEYRHLTRDEIRQLERLVGLESRYNTPEQQKALKRVGSSVRQPSFSRSPKRGKTHFGSTLSRNKQEFRRKNF